MRKSGTHSAGALGKSTGKRRRDDVGARIPPIFFAALAVGILSAAYGFTHQQVAADVDTQITNIAVPKDGKDIASAASTAPMAIKEDRIVTGSVATPSEIAPINADAKQPANADAKQQAVVKKKNPTTTAKNEAPKTFFSFFNNSQQKR